MMYELLMGYILYSVGLLCGIALTVWWYHLFGVVKVEGDEE